MKNSIEEHFWRWPCRKIPQWYEAQDEVPMVWNKLTWSTCHKSGCPPSPAARDASEALLGKIVDDAKKLYQDLFDRKNSQKLGISKSMKTQSNQSRTCKALSPRLWWTLKAPPLLCTSLNKGRTTIQTGFNQAMTSDIRRKNNTKLEMALDNLNGP